MAKTQTRNEKIDHAILTALQRTPPQTFLDANQIIEKISSEKLLRFKPDSVEILYALKRLEEQHKIGRGPLFYARV